MYIETISDFKFMQSADRLLCHQIYNNAIALCWLNQRNPISHKTFGPDSMQVHENRFVCNSHLLHVLPPQLLAFCQCHAFDNLALHINLPEISIFLSTLNTNKNIKRIQLNVAMNFREN